MDKKEQARELLKQGMKLKDIASKIGVSDRTLRNWGIKKKGKTEKGKPERKKPEKRKAKAVKNEAIESVMDNNELTEKQRLFCIAYIKNFNAAQAVIKAGYEVKDSQRAAEVGYQLLQLTPVRNEIERLKIIKAQSIMISEDDIVERYMKIAFADMTDFAEFGPKGLKLKDSKKVDGGLIKEISMSRQGTKIKLEDRERALKWLADFFEMNPEHKHRKEHDKKRLQLERERLEHTKKMDEKKDW